MSYFMMARGVKVDERGRRYADVSSDAAVAEGVSVLVPLVVVRNGEPNSVASNVSDATASAATPTQNDLRDLLSEADAILLDSSMASSSRMKASSDSSVRGSTSGKSERANGSKRVGSGMSHKSRRSTFVAGNAASSNLLTVLSFAMSALAIAAVMMARF